MPATRMEWSPCRWRFEFLTRLKRSSMGKYLLPHKHTGTPRHIRFLEEDLASPSIFQLEVQLFIRRKPKSYCRLYRSSPGSHVRQGCWIISPHGILDRNRASSRGQQHTMPYFK